MGTLTEMTVLVALTGTLVTGSWTALQPQLRRNHARQGESSTIHRYGWGHHEVRKLACSGKCPDQRCEESSMVVPRNERIGRTILGTGSGLAAVALAWRTHAVRRRRIARHGVPVTGPQDGAIDYRTPPRSPRLMLSSTDRQALAMHVAIAVACVVVSAALTAWRLDGGSALPLPWAVTIVSVVVLPIALALIDLEVPAVVWVIVVAIAAAVLAVTGSLAVAAPIALMGVAWAVRSLIGYRAR